MLVSSARRGSRTRWRAPPDPRVFRRLHPSFKTPWLSLVVFAGSCRSSSSCPGSVNFVGTPFSLGATLSFTVAHAAIVPHARTGSRRRDPVSRAPQPRGWRDRAGRSSRSSAGSRPGIVPRHPRPEPDDGMGRARLARIRPARPTSIHRRRFVHVPVRETVKAPPALGPALALEYRRLLVPVVPGPGVGRRDGRRLQPRGGAAVAHRRAERARGPARSAAGRRVPELERGANGSSTRPSRLATPTACASSAGSSARAAQAPRSSPRRGPRRGDHRARVVALRAYGHPRGSLREYRGLRAQEPPCRVIVTATEVA